MGMDDLTQLHVPQICQHCARARFSYVLHRADSPRGSSSVNNVLTPKELLVWGANSRSSEVVTEVRRGVRVRYLLPCLLKALQKRFRGERTFYKSSRASHHGGDVGWQSNFRSEVSAFRIDSGGQGVDSGVGHFGLFAVCTGSALGSSVFAGVEIKL